MQVIYSIAGRQLQKGKFLVLNIELFCRDVAGMLQVFQRKWISDYGHIYRVWMGKICFVDISCPLLVEVIISYFHFGLQIIYFILNIYFDLKKILTSQKLIDKGGSYVCFVYSYRNNHSLAFNHMSFIFMFTTGRAVTLVGHWAIIIVRYFLFLLLNSFNFPHVLCR